MTPEQDAGADPGARIADQLVSLLHRHQLGDLPQTSDDAIIELTALIAYQNMSSKFNAALGVPAQGFCTASRPGASRA